MLRRSSLPHWCVLGLVSLLITFTVVLPFVARASVGLIDMTARAQADGTILVEWETATELNTLSFCLYRDLTASGPWTEDKIVDEQAAQGDSTTGATYTFVDSDVEAGTTYYYLLEEINTDGTRTKLEDFIRSATGLSIIYLPLLSRAN